jgi:hypothetical protein
MNQKSKVLSIIAYYLSEYDIKAVRALGYKSRAEAFKQISIALDYDNNYIKLRRDEFDALPLSASTRRGWANRPPNENVQSLALSLRSFSFDELTGIVRAFIENKTEQETANIPSEYDTQNTEFSEDDLEAIINAHDPTATIKEILTRTKHRSYNISIIKQLKLLYRHECQICGLAPFPKTSGDICEAHHIDYFIDSHNNDSSNLLILCPNHHRLIHLLHPRFDHDMLAFTFEDGQVMPIVLNRHL